MSTEKADAIVIRQADFSESSRVVTFFSREFGKFAVLAKGAKRLKGPFDAALDLLSTCRVVFLRKSSGALGLLTQAQLISRFAPAPSSLNALYGGYYVADLLAGLTEEFDPHPEIFELSGHTLQALADPDMDSASVIVQFEVRLLQYVGIFPNLTACSVCGGSVESGQFAHWVSQGGLLCAACGREEYAGKKISGGTIAVLKTITDVDSPLASRVRLTRTQVAECHRFAVSAITHVLGRKPGTLRFLNF
ncbi:MAG: DNA repair protein RecO [Fuerstiella sp.]